MTTRTNRPQSNIRKGAMMVAPATLFCIVLYVKWTGYLQPATVHHLVELLFFLPAVLTILFLLPTGIVKFRLAALDKKLLAQQKTQNNGKEVRSRERLASVYEYLSVLCIFGSMWLVGFLVVSPIFIYVL
jgi:hypothetical protein